MRQRQEMTHAQLQQLVLQRLPGQRDIVAGEEIEQVPGTRVIVDIDLDGDLYVPCVRFEHDRYLHRLRWPGILRQTFITTFGRPSDFIRNAQVHVQETDPTTHELLVKLRYRGRVFAETISPDDAKRFFDFPFDYEEWELSVA